MAGQIDDYRTGAASRLEVCEREIRRASEENDARLLEASFFHRLNHRRFAASFGQCARGKLFIHQAKLRARKAALFQQRSHLRAKQRRSTRNDDSVGSPFKRWHESHGPGNQSMAEETNDV